MVKLKHSDRDLSTSSSYTVAVTNDCNRQCKTCVRKTSLNTKSVFSREKFKAAVEEFKANENLKHFRIVGGEPGLLKQEDIKFIFDLLDSENIVPAVYTNGLFTLRYGSQYPYIRQLLHITSEKDFNKLKHLDKSVNIEGLYVLSEEYLEFEHLIPENPSINFTLVFDKINSTISDECLQRLLSYPNASFKASRDFNLNEALRKYPEKRAMLIKMFNHFDCNCTSVETCDEIEA